MSTALPGHRNGYKFILMRVAKLGISTEKGPLKLTERVSENVTLKSFEDIQERIRAQMLYECGFSDGNPNEIKITVERIEMKMTIVGGKRRPGQSHVCSGMVYILC